MRRALISGFVLMGKCFMWLLPFSLLLIVVLAPGYVFEDFNESDYFRFLQIIIWPFTVLIVLFFFRKIFTYLFFSIDSFNFFGAHGNLENINAVIDREVRKQLEFEKAEQERKRQSDESNMKLKKLEEQLSEANESNSDWKEIAKGAVKGFRELKRSSDSSIEALTAENRQLKELLSNFQRVEAGEESSVVSNERVTSDPPSEESSSDRPLPPA